MSKVNRRSVSYSLPQEIVDMLKEKSMESHIPQSALVMLALSEYLSKKEKE